MRPVALVSHAFRSAAVRLRELRPWTSPDGCPVPPVRLRDKVRRGQISRDGFIREGRQVYEVIRGIADAHGLLFEPGRRVFEFGCGCGRVARHFVHDKVDITGSDVDQELIEWNIENLPQGRFIVNSYDPPLPFADDSFDLTYAISVFTHIPVDRQAPWIEEVRRVTRPGGLALVSILEHQEGGPGDTTRTEIRHDRSIRRSWLGKDNAPAQYMNVFHSRGFIEREWGGKMEIVEFRERAIRGVQSVVVMRK